MTHPWIKMSVKYTRVSVNSTPTKKDANYWDYLFAEAEENFMMTNIIPLPGKICHTMTVFVCTKNWQGGN